MIRGTGNAIGLVIVIEASVHFNCRKLGEVLIGFK